MTPICKSKETIVYGKNFSLCFAFVSDARRIFIKSALFFGRDARITPSSRLDLIKIHSGYRLICFTDWCNDKIK